MWLHRCVYVGQYEGLKANESRANVQHRCYGHSLKCRQINLSELRFDVARMTRESTLILLSSLHIPHAICIAFVPNMRKRLVKLSLSATNTDHLKCWPIAVSPHATEMRDADARLSILLTERLDARQFKLYHSNFHKIQENSFEIICQMCDVI